MPGPLLRDKHHAPARRRISTTHLRPKVPGRPHGNHGAVSWHGTDLAAISRRRSALGDGLGNLGLLESQPPDGTAQGFASVGVWLLTLAVQMTLS